MTKHSSRLYRTGAIAGAIAMMAAACGGPSTGGTTPEGQGTGQSTEQPTLPSGTVVSESDRARWSDALAAFNTAAAEGYSAAECADIVQRFSTVNDQHASRGRFVEAIFMIALTHERCGNAQAAREWYDRALSVNEGFCGARVARGIAHFQAGRIQEAQQEFERAVRDDTRCTEGYVNLAIVQRRTPSQRTEALNNLRRALAIEASYLPAFNQMALLYLDQAIAAAPAQATVAGGQAAQSSEDDSDESTRAARRAAARRAAASQYLDLATVVCRQAQIINANYAPIYNTWGLVNVQQGDIVAALAKFELATRLDNNFFEAFMNFGELTLSFRGFEDAERAFRRATELQTNSYDAWLGLGAALRGLQRNEEARAAYDRAVAIDANRAEAYYNIALLYADYSGGSEPEMRQAQDFFRQFASRAEGRPELAEIVQSVTRSCGQCDHQRQGNSARRSARRARAAARGYGRRQTCARGRIETIECGIILGRELQEMQRQAEEMQRQLEAQAAEMERRAQEQAAQPAPQ